jgi:hypothetical protein
MRRKSLAIQRFQKIPAASSKAPPRAACIFRIGEAVSIKYHTSSTPHHNAKSLIPLIFFFFLFLPSPSAAIRAIEAVIWRSFPPTKRKWFYAARGRRYKLGGDDHGAPRKKSVISYLESPLAEKRAHPLFSLHEKGISLWRVSHYCRAWGVFPWGFVALYLTAHCWQAVAVVLVIWKSIMGTWEGAPLSPPAVFPARNK